MVKTKQRSIYFYYFAIIFNIQVLCNVIFEKQQWRELNADVYEIIFWKQPTVPSWVKFQNLIFLIFSYQNTLKLAISLGFPSF